MAGEKISDLDRSANFSRLFRSSASRKERVSSRANASTNMIIVFLSDVQNTLSSSMRA